MRWFHYTGSRSLIFDKFWSGFIVLGRQNPELHKFAVAAGLAEQPAGMLDFHLALLVLFEPARTTVRTVREHQRPVGALDYGPQRLAVVAMFIIRLAPR